MEDEPDRYARLLQSHLSVNPKTWEALQARGVDEDTPLRLDFEYTAPGEDEVRTLMRHLRTSTDYEFQGGARNQKDGSQRWLILGSTSPATWSVDKLDAWVTEMTSRGREHGPASLRRLGRQHAERRRAGQPQPQGPDLRQAAPARALISAWRRPRATGRRATSTPAGPRAWRAARQAPPASGGRRRSRAGVPRSAPR